MKTNKNLQERLENRLVEIYGSNILKTLKFECFYQSIPQIMWYNTELLDIDIIIDVTGDKCPNLYIEEDEIHGKYFCIIVSDINENEELPF